jgi:uncharacterized protein YfdQ (DUF2303 family)
MSAKTENYTENKNLLETAFEVSKKLLEPTKLHLGDNNTEVMALPEGIKLQSIKPFLDEYLTAPERRKGVAKLTSLDSFIAHVNRFKDDDSALFANDSRESPSITAVLDYHCIGSDSNPRFGEHRSFYNLPLSNEWGHWHGSNGKSFTQAEFAAFLEDRIVDVINVHDDMVLSERIASFKELIRGSFASPTKLMELAAGLNVTQDEDVKSNYNLQSGEAQLGYTSKHRGEDGQPLTVPKMFMIAIPVFLHGALYQIAVRLRYRLKQGTISWFYEMHQTDLVFDDAFTDTCNQASEQTKLPIFLGEPE